MLLLGLLLISTVLVGGQTRTVGYITICTKDGEIKFVKSTESTDRNLTDLCDNVQNQSFRDELLTVRHSSATGFHHGWYQLRDPSIATIVIIQTPISEITNEFINDLPENIKTVVLWSSKIECLKEGILENSNLYTLSFLSNSINEIESSALEKLPQLGHLSLKRNKLTNTKFAATLPSALESLNLMYNAITEISAGSFLKLRKLTRLSLKGNKITAIQEQAFQGLANLQCLHLSENPLAILENGLFKSTPLLNWVSSEISREICQHINNRANYSSELKRAAFSGIIVLCDEYKRCIPSTPLTDGDGVLSLYMNKTLEISKDDDCSYLF